jgi:S-adenosylmethionine:tRNA ribosyltransferase-isomerase
MYECRFHQLKDLLDSQDHLIFNNTKVIPARLTGRRAGGGTAEIFLSKRLTHDCWEVLAKPGKKLKPGSQVYFSDDFSCQVIDTYPDGLKRVQFKWQGVFEEVLALHGHMPLPHYIQREDQLEDKTCYQTVYAMHPGAVAAPTAGLHFTEELLQDLKQRQVKQTYLTLHVGLGTFKPVQVDDIRQHPMHKEQIMIDPQAALELNQPCMGKRICVGTTCCRALEATVQQDHTIQAGCYETDIFIYPGYRFQYVEGLITNFHLPRSTLLMLVAAFAGYDLIMEAYAKAIKDRFRFYSYGDAMLIL